MRALNDFIRDLVAANSPVWKIAQSGKAPQTDNDKFVRGILLTLLIARKHRPDLFSLPNCAQEASLVGHLDVIDQQLNACNKPSELALFLPVRWPAPCISQCLVPICLPPYPQSYNINGTFANGSWPLLWQVFKDIEHYRELALQGLVRVVRVVRNVVQRLDELTVQVEREALEAQCNAAACQTLEEVEMLREQARWSHSPSRSRGAASLI